MKDALPSHPNQTHSPKTTLRRWELALLLALALAALTGARLDREQQALSGRLIRLHVVANSDSPADQAVKLQVRDAVLAESGLRLAGLDRAQALEALSGALPQLGRTAADAVAAAGYSYPVRVTLRPAESFPTRRYGAFALPAGTYTALRVELGEARGQNWWCVLFPPLCLGSVTDAAQTALTPSQLSLITQDAPAYVVKFKAMETWARVKQSLSP